MNDESIGQTFINCKLIFQLSAIILRFIIYKMTQLYHHFSHRSSPSLNLKMYYFLYIVNPCILSNPNFLSIFNHKKKKKFFLNVVLKPYEKHYWNFKINLGKTDCYLLSKFYYKLETGTNVWERQFKISFLINNFYRKTRWLKTLVN